MVELSIPAQEEMLLVVRMVMSGLCTKCGMDMDTVESVRIAADEACYCLMHQQQPTERLHLHCKRESGHLRIHFTVTRAQDAPRDYVDHDPEIARCILETLIPEVILSCDELGVYGIELIVGKGAA